MPDVVAFPRRTRLRKPTIAEALVFEIVHSLQAFGGQAHRDIVISDIARRAGFDPRNPPQNLREDLISAFDYGLAHGGLGHEQLFVLPFGPGSYRWRLADEAATADLEHARFGETG